MPRQRAEELLLLGVGTSIAAFDRKGLAALHWQRDWACMRP
jgi:hypothetical protein